MSFETHTLEADDGSSYAAHVHGTSISNSEVAIIAIHEWWGLGDIIDQHAAELSSTLQAITLVPDLYRGRVASGADEAHHLMSSLNFDFAVADVRKAVGYLKDKFSTVKHVFVAGFCMGGALSLLSIAGNTLFSGAICFYGVPGGFREKLSTVTTPVLMHFGDKDVMQGFSDPQTAADAADTMKNAGAIVQLHMYEGQGHAFMNKPGLPLVDAMREKDSANMTPFSADAHKLAMQRTVDFVKSITQVA